MAEQPFKLIPPPTVSQLQGMLSDEVEAGTHSIKPLKDAFDDANRRILGRPGGVPGETTVLGAVMESDRGFFADVIAGAFSFEAQRTLIAFGRGLHYRDLVQSGKLEGVQVVHDFQCALGGDCNIDYVSHGLVSGTGKIDLGPKMQAMLDAVASCFDVANPGQRGEGAFIFKFATGNTAGGCSTVDHTRRLGSGYWIMIPLDSTVFTQAAENDQWAPMRPMKPFRNLRLASHVDKIRSKLSGGSTMAYVSFVKAADGLDKGFEQRSIADVRSRAQHVSRMVKACNDAIESELKDYDDAEPSAWVGITFTKQPGKMDEEVGQLRNLLSELVGARQTQPVDTTRDAALTALINKDQKEREARDLINRNLSDKDRNLLLSLPKSKKPEDMNVYIAVARMVGSRPDHCPLDHTWTFQSLSNIDADPMDTIGDFHGYQMERLFKSFMKDPRIVGEKDTLWKKNLEDPKLLGVEQTRAEISALVDSLPASRHAATKTSVGIACCRVLDYSILRYMMASKGIAKEETMRHVLQSDRALSTSWNLLCKRDSMPQGNAGGGGGGGAKRRPRAFSAGGRQPAHARRREREASREGSPLKILPAAQRGGWAPHVPSKSSGGAARGGKPKQGPAGGCYECGGPHYADKCPTKKKQPRRMIL
eukprot:gene35170-63887_t